MVYVVGTTIWAGSCANELLLKVNYENFGSHRPLNFGCRKFIGSN